MRISDWSSDVCSSDLLDRVQRRTLADVVRDYPQVEPALVRQVLADAADEDRVVARGVRDRRRIAAVGGLVDHLHARRGLKQFARPRRGERSEEHTSELQSLIRLSYAVFCLKKKKQHM